MATYYRFRCGQCNHRTPWLGQSQGADQHQLHYATRHPGVEPSGDVEIRGSRTHEGIGCLMVVGALLLLLLLAASCLHQPARGSTSQPWPADRLRVTTHVPGP